MLDHLPIAEVLFLCRRYPESLPVFLAYFDSLPARKTDPKIYLPCIVPKARMIPIQWIYDHLLLIQEVRCASQVLNSATSAAIVLELNPHETIKKQTKIWQDFRLLVPTVGDISWFDAWDKLTDLRMDLKDLSDLKMNLRLADYHQASKPEFVRRILEGCQTHCRLEALIRSRLAPYCAANEVHLPKVLAGSVAARDSCTVTQKLQVFD
jgi:hypothetical protein